LTKHIDIITKLKKKNWQNYR